MALKAPLGADGVLAFTGPEAMDSGYLKLRWGGFFFPLPFSAVDISRAQLVRAVLENICFAIKANCNQLEAIATQSIAQVSFGGGLIRSQCLRQIIPSILERPVGFASVSETSGLGAAILAAIGCRTYSGLDEALEAMISQVRN